MSASFKMAGGACCCCNHIFTRTVGFSPRRCETNGPNAEIDRFRLISPHGSSPSHSHLELIGVDAKNKYAFFAGVSANGLTPPIIFRRYLFSVDDIKWGDNAAITETDIFGPMDDRIITAGVCDTGNQRLFYAWFDFNDGAVGAAGAIGDLKISVMNYDGTGDTLLHTEAITDNPGYTGVKLAYDHENLKVYFAYKRTGVTIATSEYFIGRIDDDGTNATDVVTNNEIRTSQPSVLLGPDKLYYVCFYGFVSGSETRQIRYCDLDGTNDALFREGDLLAGESLRNLVTGLFTSHKQQKVYWYEKTVGVSALDSSQQDYGLMRADPDGSNVEVVIPAAFGQSLWSATNISDLEYATPACGYENPGFQTPPA